MTENGFEFNQVIVNVNPTCKPKFEFLTPAFTVGLKIKYRDLKALSNQILF
jgi:hypothetical protein